MTIAKVGVIGAGVMGAGIAQRCAAYAYAVVLVDERPAQLRSAESRIRESLDKFVKKGSISQAKKDETLRAIEFAGDLGRVAGCQLAIEAVTEDPELKKNVFRELDRVCPPDAILASNTSSIPLASLAAVTRRPDKVMGIHFMNPVPLVDLAELIPTGATSEATVKTCRNFARSLGVETVESKDSPGFIINRILIPMINEAARVLAEGVASAEDIDRAMVLGTRQPMGPLALADLIGLDTVVFILQTMRRELKDERHKPCPLLEAYVCQNRLGRKTGQGFHSYS